MYWLTHLVTRRYPAARRQACVLLLLFSGGLSGAIAGEAPPRTVDYGPLFSRTVDLHGHVRLRALGPIFERSEAADGRTLRAVRPLYSHYENPAMERTRSEYLWPIGHSKRFRNIHSGRVLIAFWQVTDVQDPQSRYRFWILPVYFQGRDKDGENYLALFPFGGRIAHILGQEEIRFFLWPLYTRTELNTIVSRSYLWPIISHTSGKGIHRFRVAPFYGQNRHRDRYHKRFVLWPFWTQAEYYYRGASGSGFILFPFYGQLLLENQRSYMVLPPFFRISRGDRGHQTLAPWPFFQRRTGEIRQTYIFPLFGQKHTAITKNRFLLWPLLRQHTVDRGSVSVSRNYAMPFYSGVTQRERAQQDAPPLELNAPVPRGRVIAQQHKVWPLYSYARQEEESRLRMLSLWPFTNPMSIERNYAPFWTLLERTRVGDHSDTELLWGLYRRQVRGAARARTSLFPLVEWERDDRPGDTRRSWSLLKGLIGHEQRGVQRRIRLLYWFRIPLSNTGETTP